jgi:Flp pilus assembly protein TadB
MSWELLFGITGLFIAIAVLTGAAAATLLARRTPERQRLSQMVAGGGVVLDLPSLTDAPSSLLKHFKNLVPKSPKEMSILRRKLTAAGYNGLDAAILFGLAKFVLPIVFAVTILSIVGPGSRGVVMAVIGAMCGFMAPELFIAYKTRGRQKVIRNGLPDALESRPGDSEGHQRAGDRVSRARRRAAAHYDGDQSRQAETRGVQELRGAYPGR